MISMKKFLNIYSLVICLIYFFNISYFNVFLGQIPSFYIYVILWGTVSFLSLVIKSNVILSFLILVCNYLISPLGQEFGNLSFIYVLWFGIILSDEIKEKRLFDYNYFEFFIGILISVMYLSLLKIRVIDTYWGTGRASMVVSQSSQFRGFFSLSSVEIDGYFSRICTYIFFCAEFTISLLVWTRLRKYAFLIGALLHLSLLFFTSIFHLNLFMSLFYIVLTLDNSLSLKRLIPINRAKLKEKSPNVTMDPI